MPGQMIFHNSSLLYGRTGTGKTSNAGFFARYIYEISGKITRMIAADQGGYRPLLHLVRNLWTRKAQWNEVNPHGIIDLVDLRNYKYCASMMRKLANGTWIGKIQNIGGVEKLIPIPPGDKTWKEVGGYIVESIESLGDDFLGTLRGGGVKLSEKPAFTYTEISDFGEPETFYGSNQSQYGLAQNQIWETIKNFSSLPVHMLWTSRESVSEEETTKTQFIGPAAPGNKLTPKIPPMMGECIHAQMVMVEKKRELRLWFEPHKDPVAQREFDAKARVPPEVMPQLRERFNVKGYMIATFTEGLDVFLREQDDLLKKATGDLEAWKKKVRG